MNWYERAVGALLLRPARVLAVFSILFIGSLGLYGTIGTAFFPRTDGGQFIINVKGLSGTKLNVTEQEVAKAEALIRNSMEPADLSVILIASIGFQNYVLLRLCPSPKLESDGCR